jgi:hypothetical protein
MAARRIKQFKMLGMDKNDYHSATQYLYLWLFSKIGFNAILPLLQAKTLPSPFLLQSSLVKINDRI